MPSYLARYSEIILVHGSNNNGFSLNLFKKIARDTLCNITTLMYYKYKFEKNPVNKIKAKVINENQTGNGKKERIPN